MFHAERKGSKDSAYLTRRMESDTTAPIKFRTIRVVPAQQGVDVQPIKQKKQLTEAQLAALKRGRDKLAERRAKERGEEQQQEVAPIVVAEPVVAAIAAPAPNPEGLKQVATEAAVQTVNDDVSPVISDTDTEEDGDSGGGMCVIM
jgi:hypothetical protein